MLDHCTPVGVAKFFPEHEVSFCGKLGWNRIANGQLISAAESAGFDLMISCDTNIQYQQNRSKRRISPVVLGSNDWPEVKRHSAAIIAAVESASPNSFAKIPIPSPKEVKRLATQSDKQT
jgi:hypothetical protein